MVEGTRGVRADRAGRKIQIRWRHRGRDYSETLEIRPTKAGLEQAHRIRNERIAACRFGQESAYTVSFSQIAQRYLDNAPIALSTHNSYRDSLNIYWMPSIGHLNVREVRYATLKRIDEQVEWKSEKTRSNALTALRQVFAYALELDAADHNPAIKFRVRRHQREAPDPYSMAERTALLSALGPRHAYLYFRVAFDTGMRTGELLALRWGDFDGDSFTVKRSKVRRVEKDSTKTNKERRVMLGAETIQLLESQPAQFPRQPIFLNQYNRPYQSGFHLNKAFRKAHREAGVRLRSGPYPWRHTYASLGIQAGLPPAFLAKQLGHSLDVFYRRYATWISGSDDRELIAKLSESWRA